MSSPAASAQISELTLSWINVQLRRELLRRIAEQNPPKVVRTYGWQRQMIAAVSGVLSGFALFAKNPFA